MISLNCLDHLIHEFFTLNVDNLHVRLALKSTVGDSVHKVSFTKTGRTPNEKGVDLHTNVVCNVKCRRVRKSVGITNDEVFKGVVIVIGESAFSAFTFLSDVFLFFVEIVFVFVLVVIQIIVIIEIEIVLACFFLFKLMLSLVFVDDVHRIVAASVVRNDRCKRGINVYCNFREITDNLFKCFAYKIDVFS